MSRRHRYLIALGSNMRHPRYGGPRAVLAAALRKLEKRDITVKAVSPTITSDPVGPSSRRYANGAAVVKTRLAPQDLLSTLKKVERKFGRRIRGQRWRARVLDLDIVLWDGGSWVSDDLVIPHPLFRQRAFVLGPAAAIARDWRDPLSALTLGQLNTRLTRRRPLPR